MTSIQCVTPGTPRRHFFYQLGAIAATYALGKLEARTAEKAVASQANTTAPKITEIKDPGNLSGKEKAIRLIDQVIADLEKDNKENEAKTIHSLERFRHHFEKNGSVAKELRLSKKSTPGSISPTDCRFKWNMEMGFNPTVKVTEVIPRIQEDLLNEYWKFRNNPYIRMHFASQILKQAAYIILVEEVPEKFSDWITSSRTFITELNGFTQSRTNSSPTWYKDLASNTNIFNASKAFSINDLSLGYTSSKVRLEFLHRQNFRSFDLASFLRESNPSARLLYHLQVDRNHLQFVSPKGVLAEDDYRKQMITDLYDLLDNDDIRKTAMRILSEGTEK